MIILLLLSPIYLWLVLLVLLVHPTSFIGARNACGACKGCSVRGAYKVHGGYEGCNAHGAYGACKAYEYNTILTKETDCTEFKSFFTDISIMTSFIDTSMSGFGGNGNNSLKLLHSVHWLFNTVTIKTIKRNEIYL